MAPPTPPLWSGSPASPGDHHWLAQEPPRPLPAEPEPEPPPPPPSRRWKLLAILASALALLAIGTTAGLLIDGRDGGAPGTRAAAAPVKPPVAAGGVPATPVNKIYAAVSQGVAQIRTGSSSGTGFLIDA